MIFLLIALAALLGPLWAYIGHKYVQYAITNRRLIVQSGMIGRDFQSVDLDQVIDVSVDVGMFDKLGGKESGSINITTAGTVDVGKSTASKTYRLANISAPYEIFKLLQRKAINQRSDISYPNAKRPKENDGYKTEDKTA
jgi:uncharacterized membrane protein YdbT with pleckstrin-like domain